MGLVFERVARQYNMFSLAGQDASPLMKKANLNLQRVMVPHELYRMPEFHNPVVFLDKGTEALESICPNTVYKRHHVIGTDGAYRRRTTVYGKRRFAGWGVAFCSGVFRGARCSGSAEDEPLITEEGMTFRPTSIKSTSNRGEAQALLVALYLATRILELHKDATFEIILDSAYVMNSVVKWMPTWLKNEVTDKKNMDLLLPAYRLHERLMAQTDIRIVHVHSHIPLKDIGTHPDFKDNPHRWYANDAADGAAVTGVSGYCIDPRFEHWLTPKAD